MPERTANLERTVFSPGLPRTYTGRQLDEIAFPLGGIGTGSISLGGWGQLRDFEIFNRPAKGLSFQYTFFTLWAKPENGPSVTRVIQGPVGGFFTGAGSGVDRSTGAGLPRFRNCRFSGGFPIARIDFDDPDVPLDVSLEAFNPFIPLNDRDSSIPVAIFLFHLLNPSDTAVSAHLFANLENRTGHPDVGRGVIRFFEGQHASGLAMTTTKHPPESPRFGSLALATPWRTLNVATHWFRGSWFDSLHRFWDQVSETGLLDEIREDAQADDNATDVGSIGLLCEVPPHGQVTLPILIAWHNPVFEMYWREGHPTWLNYYASLFRDAWHVAEYVVENLERLESETRTFRDTLFQSTLPEPVLDAVSSQLSTLKTTTCLRLTDGTFYAFEGCHPSAGCCEGTCTHVWNYAQALPFLFPNLERSIREADYAYNQSENGHMTFRMPLPLGTHAKPTFHAAADGQMGGIMKVYREWLISGDDEWLRRLWPSVKRALEYAWKFWDHDRDGVMEGVQHNTYDIEFYGPNTFTGTFYLGALRAGEEMARRLGDEESAERYRELYESGRAWIDANLFNGEYYRQDVRPDAGKLASHDVGAQDRDPITGWPKYQYGDGCLSDQLLGQWVSEIVGLGKLLDHGNIKTTLASIFRYNWRPDLTTHANPQRVYALNDEAGLLVCTWPKGGRPAFPFPYCDEVWTGIEYQVASHLIYEGFVEEGVLIVKSARDRHDGTRRNPWNEFECGNHYARAMSSYGLLLALSGYHVNAVEGRLSFHPRIHANDFRCFFSTAQGWGLYSQTVRQGVLVASIECRYGVIHARSLSLPVSPRSAIAALDGAQITSGIRDGAVTFDPEVSIAAGHTLTVVLGI
ncbi:MAG: GH116 family glycosyl-hydrolase [Armatimonadota bacterium]